MTTALTALSVAALLPSTLWATNYRRKTRNVCRQLHEVIFMRAPQLARLVRWECARTDRNGAVFAMAVFPLGEAAKDEQVVKRYEKALRKHARLTDVVGWLNQDSLCAVLVDADAKGALTFATKLHEAAAQGAAVAEPIIYTYGGKWATTRENTPHLEPAFAMSA